MSRLFHVLGALLCLGCAPAAQDAAPVDPAPVEAIRPAGPYAAGFAIGPTLTHGAQSRVYYPAATPGSDPRPEVFSDDHETQLERRFGLGVSRALAEAVTAAREGAPRVADRFPLVVFQPGSEMASTDYRLLIEAVVSRGYVIMALNPDGSPRASRGRYDAAAEEFAEAVKIARTGHTALAGADTSRIALMGHSLGGAAAMMALPNVPHALAVNLDGDLPDRLDIPANRSVLYLIGQTDGESSGSRGRRETVWRQSSAQAGDAVPLQVTRIKHFDFADAALLQEDVPVSRRATRFGAIGGQAAHALTVDLVSAFLDSRLKGDATAWTAARARHPEAVAPTTW